MGNPKGYKAPKGERGVYLRQDPVERLRRKFVVGPVDECWPWLAGLDQGYGRFWTGSGFIRGHRAVYKLLVNAIADDVVLDHLCHGWDRTCEGGESCLHRRCVNPAHLEETTLEENKRRGQSAPARNARKTHCPHGHPLSGENLMRQTNGDRRCRTCVYARNAAAYRRGRAKGPAA